jgi:hypothetical protein
MKIAIIGIVLMGFLVRCGSDDHISSSRYYNGYYNHQGYYNGFNNNGYYNNYPGNYRAYPNGKEGYHDGYAKGKHHKGKDWD